jgi:hypothetical protein
VSAARAESTVQVETEESPYALPLDFTSGFAPNPACFTEDGYEDDSIRVQMETREQDGTVYRIAWVEIASPSQLRTAIAGGDTVPQFYTYSATNVRLQEASIGYTIPRKALGNLFDMTLQLVGRNLWMIYCKAPFDPESVASATNTFYQGIDYFMTPATRNFGFNVRLNF